MQGQAIPTIANVDDIDKRFAERAYSGVSFSPEKRGEQFREDYASHVNGLYADLWTIAQTEEQRRILADEMDRYRAGYLSRCNALLSSKSRVVSTMIAGPSNFPVEQMRKRSDSEHNRLNELIEWSKAAQSAIKRRLLDARPDEVKASAEWNRLARDIASSLGTIHQIDAGAEFYTRSAFVNSIAGKVERLARNGEIELVDKALEFVRSYAGRPEVKKPAISARHKFWTFGELARENAAKLAEASQAESQTIASADGVEAIVNPEIDRVQLVFDGKPDTSTVSILKSGGWNWSPSNGAWQRKLTPNAVYAAKQVVGKLQTV
jgi:hypothetical protein